MTLERAPRCIIYNIFFLLRCYHIFLIHFGILFTFFNFSPFLTRCTIRFFPFTLEIDVAPIRMGGNRTRIELSNLLFDF